MKNEINSTNFQSENLGKDDLTKSLVILLGMDGFEGQLKKLSLPALRKMYDGLLNNAVHVSQVRRDAHEARKELKISQDRSSSLERDLNRLKKGK